MALAIQKELPGHEVIFKDDSEHVPYGTRSLQEIYAFTKPILNSLVAEGCQVIVIACNTVTTNLIEQLRAELPIPLLGMEPMVKPAARETKTGVIAVCATPRTLASKRYQWLKQNYAKEVKVLEPDCSDWSYMIENNSLDREKIIGIVESVCSQSADQIVLGCTHYHWIEELINDSARGRAKVIHPEKPMTIKLKQVLEQLV